MNYINNFVVFMDHLHYFLWYWYIVIIWIGLYVYISVAFLQRVNDSSNMALIDCRLIDSLQMLDTQSFGILRLLSGLNRGKW